MDVPEYCVSPGLFTGGAAPGETQEPPRGKIAVAAGIFTTTKVPA